MFENFNFKILANPEFKEDSVREELISPILNRLGYSATGEHQITRSKSLKHPYVMIGSKQHPIYIVPDYLLKVDNSPVFVLDAKAPSESLYKSNNVEQVYSYAIHPDVRVPLYVLCNGHEFVIYDLFQVEPILRFKVSEIEKNWEKLENILSPQSVLKPHKRDFAPDFGLLVYKAGCTNDVDWYFLDNEVSDVTRVCDDLYTVSSGIESGLPEEEIPHFISLDFNSETFQQLLNFASEEAQVEISIGLSRQPYLVQLSNPFKVGIEAHLGKVQNGKDEQFIPFLVTKVFSHTDTNALERNRE